MTHLAPAVMKLPVAMVMPPPDIGGVPLLSTFRDQPRLGNSDLTRSVLGKYGQDYIVRSTTHVVDPDDVAIKSKRAALTKCTNDAVAALVLDDGVLLANLRQVAAKE